MLSVRRSSGNPPDSAPHRGATWPGVQSACNKQESRQVIGQHVRRGHLSTMHGSMSDSQADSAGSIPVTRSTREKRCNTSESGAISHTETAPVGIRNRTPCPPRALGRRPLTRWHWCRLRSQNLHRAWSAWRRSHPRWRDHGRPWVLVDEGGVHACVPHPPHQLASTRPRHCREVVACMTQVMNVDAGQPGPVQCPQEPVRLRHRARADPAVHEPLTPRAHHRWSEPADVLPAQNWFDV